ncbi:conserved hypothetical protein [Burkholderiales bacterium 8X]|nr:conserved hypothetical protein [Burkholderiales bacterium 8X]
MRWALVTGAAGRGGAAICRALHARGLGVVIHHSPRSGDKAALLQQQLESGRAGSTRLWQADFANDALAVPDWLREQEIEIVVCNASVYEPSNIGDAARARLDMAIHVGAHAAILAALRPLSDPEGKRSALRSVVGITDIGVERPPRGYAGYTMAKAALQALMLSLANEWAPSVRVNVVQPGTLPYPADWTDAERADKIDRSIPLGRLGRFEELASAVVYLALDATYVTGQVLAVDGGRSRQLH